MSLSSEVGTYREQFHPEQERLVAYMSWFEQFEANSQQALEAGESVVMREAEFMKEVMRLAEPGLHQQMLALRQSSTKSRRFLLLLRDR